MVGSKEDACEEQGRLRKGNPVTLLLLIHGDNVGSNPSGDDIFDLSAEKSFKRL